MGSLDIYIWRAYARHCSHHHLGFSQSLIDETFREGGRDRGALPQNLSAGHAAGSQASNRTQKLQATKKVVYRGSWSPGWENECPRCRLYDNSRSAGCQRGLSSMAELVSDRLMAKIKETSQGTDAKCRISWGKRTRLRHEININRMSSGNWERERLCCWLI